MSVANISRLLLMGGAGLLFACSSAPPSAPATVAASAPRLIAYVFAPSGPAAPLYNAPTAPFTPEDAFSAELVALTAEAARAQGRPPPVPDPRLFSVAQELARILPEDRTLPYTPIEFALNHYGVVEPTPVLRLAFVNLGERPDVRDLSASRELAQYFGGRLGEVMNDGFFRRVGVGSAPRGDGRHAVILVLQESFIDLQPVPRALGRGEALTLRGTILPPFREPHVAVTREDGSVVRADTRTRGAAFETSIRCSQTSGRMQVEINARAEQGPAVLANFPVWCDAYPPHEVTWSEAGQRITSGGPAAEELLLELVNAERERAGLPVLRAHARLADVARAFSQEMKRRGVVAHTLEGSGEAKDRVSKAGIPFTQVAENLARAGDVEDAHRGLMNSPGHRANILNPQLQEIGIGIVQGEGESSADLFVTQLFIRSPTPFARDTALPDLQARIVAATKLTPSPELHFLAQEHVEALVRGETNDAATAATLEKLARSKAPFTRVDAMYAAASDLAAFDAQALKTKGMTHFGLGAAQAEHPQLGKNAIYLVVLMAKKR